MNAKKCTSFIDCAEPKTLVLEKKGYQINQCNTCGHRFAKVSQDVSNHLAEVYSDKYFFEGKDGYPNYLKEKGLLYKSGIRYAKILSKYTKPGTVLDVGCAAGFILKGFEDSGWQCKGLEPNDTMAAYGRKELKLDIVTGGLENFKTPQKFDLVNIIQVMGSLYDTDKSLAAVAALVKQGGLIMVESWDMDSTAARKLGKNWHEYCPPTIINWFSDKTLQQAFNYYGMELVAQGRPSKWINVNHGISLFAESSPKFIFKKPFLKFCSFFFGKLNVPYPAIDLKWYLFKKI